MQKMTSIESLLPAVQNRLLQDLEAIQTSGRLPSSPAELVLLINRLTLVAAWEGMLIDASRVATILMFPAVLTNCEVVVAMLRLVVGAMRTSLRTTSHRADLVRTGLRILSHPFAVGQKDGLQQSKSCFA